MKKIFIFICLFSILIYIYIKFFSQTKKATTIEKLLKILNDEQIKKDSSTFLPPILFYENRGLYKSYVKWNLFGSYGYRILRKIFFVPDSNMFISNFVSLVLIESWELGAIEFPKEQMELTIDTILNFKDKNRNETIYTFWLQNEGINFWSAQPLNLIFLIELYDKFDAVMKYVLTTIGLENIYKEYLEYFVVLFSFFKNAFKIPSDFDDTSVNLALGSKLYQFRSEFPGLYSKWQEINGNLNSTLSLYDKYSYKPFSNSKLSNLIDGRSYYWLQDFLITQTNNKNFSLITTWFSNFDENYKSYPDVIMPSNLNNIDLSVNMNFLFGISHIMLTHPETITPEILNIYKCVTDLVVWVIQTETILKRPDLVILYYPSIYDFYWFVSRTYEFLNKNIKNLSFSEAFDTHSKLENILKNTATNQILNLSISDESGVYWQDFLGLNDTSYQYGDDRLFSTGLAINFLINTWTYTNNKKVLYKEQTPIIVKEILEKAIKFINNEILEDNYSKENAFFSGSFKGDFSSPFYYPTNFWEYINGTNITLNDPNVDAYFMNATIGVSGFIEKEIYDKMLNDTYWGHEVPKIFPGYNTHAFPYWSSPAMTYGISLLGLTKYNQLKNN